MKITTRSERGSVHTWPRLNGTGCSISSGVGLLIVGSKSNWEARVQLPEESQGQTELWTMIKRIIESFRLCLETYYHWLIIVMVLRSTDTLTLWIKLSFSLFLPPSIRYLLISIHLDEIRFWGYLTDFMRMDRSSGWDHEGKLPTAWSG